MHYAQIRRNVADAANAPRSDAPNQLTTAAVQTIAGTPSLKPTASGIGNRRMLAAATMRGMHALDQVLTLAKARAAGDANAKAIMGDARFKRVMKDFIGLLGEANDALLADPDTENLEPGEEPEWRREQIAAAAAGDAATTPRSRSMTGSFGVQQLHAALTTEHGAARTFAARNPGVGFDEALTMVARVSDLPAWASDHWSEAARAEMLRMALSNGRIAGHIAAFSSPVIDAYLKG